MNRRTEMVLNCLTNNDLSQAYYHLHEMSVTELRESLSKNSLLTNGERQTLLFLLVPNITSLI